MPLSLHATTVPQWLHILGSVRHLVDKAEVHCADHGLAPAELIEARLFEDMHPFSYQVMSCATHTEGAIAAVRTGRGSPNLSTPPTTFAGLAALLDHAIGALAAVDPAELEQAMGRQLIFSITEQFWLEYTAETFLLSFSQPNFYFHATTAYDLLRMKGVAIGKRDYLGALPVRN